MKQTLLERAIAIFSPSAALNRMRSRAMIQNATRTYEGAAKGRRTKDWKATGASSNMEVGTALVTLRNRSRYMVRNNASARNAIRIIANNVVGTGILPTPKYKGANAEKINKKLKEIWASWADKVTCDHEGQLNFYGLQHLCTKAMGESGECLIRRIYAPSDNFLPLELQVMEADFIDTTKHDYTWNDNGERNYYGIRFNRRGKRVGYWLYKSHPVEFAQGESVLVPAEDIIHLYEQERPGQIRGIPFSSASMLRMKDLDDYEDAELMRQKIAACFSVFVTKDNPSGEEVTTEGDLERVEPGIIEYLQPGEQVAFAQPPATQGYDAYNRAVKRDIAAGIGITYESMTGDLSNTNFSSGRMGWIEAQRNFNHWQWNIVIPKLCATVYEWFVLAAGLKGYVPIGIDVPVSWTPPRREMIDPVKETEAAKELVRAGFKSWRSTVKEFGDVPEEVLEEIKEETKMFEEAGLKPECNPKFDTPGAQKKNSSSTKDTTN